MKKDIHPKYYSEAKVTCVCGNTFTTGSTKKEIHVEICSQCHPFFTGKMKFIDTLGRVESFQKKQKAAVARDYVNKKERKRAANKKAETRPQTLKEMIQAQSKKAKTKK